MAEFVRNLVISVGLAVLISVVSSVLGSSFVVDLLSANLFMLIVALLAINVASIGVVASRLYDLKEKHDVSFKRTANSMRNSLWEQIGLLSVLVLAGVIGTSSSVLQRWPFVSAVTDIVVIAVFIWSIAVLYDTTNSMLVLLRE